MVSYTASRNVATSFNVFAQIVLTTLSLTNLLLYMPLRSSGVSMIQVSNLCNNLPPHQSFITYGCNGSAVCHYTCNILHASSRIPVKLFNHARKAHLRQFSWTEDAVSELRQHVSETLPPKFLNNSQLQPVFCFQTAVQMMLWSRLAYRYT